MKKLSLILFVLSLSLSLWADQTINSGDNVQCGKQVRITAIANSGYEFLYWADDPTNTDPVRIVNVTEAVNLKAIFKGPLDPADFVLPGEGIIKLNGGDGPINPEIGDEVIVEAIAPDDCQEFDYWEGLDESDPNYRMNPYVFTYDPANVPSIKAKFKIKEFTVTAEIADDRQGTITIEIID